MTRTEAWGIKTKQGKFVNFPVYNVAMFEAYRIITFRTKRQAQEWLNNDKFWSGKAEVVPLVITTRERGVP